MHVARSITGGLLLGLLTATGAAAFSSGPPDGRAGDPPAFNNCTGCHSSFPVDSGDGELRLRDVPAEYEPGVTYMLTIEVEDPDQERWGFEITAIGDGNDEGGALTKFEGDVTTQISGTPGDDVRDYGKHTSAGTQIFALFGIWTLQWTAPEAGTGDVTFYLAGNAANNNGSTSGDYIYLLQATSEEATALGVDEAPPIADAGLMRAWPNPLRGPDLNLSVDLAGAGAVDVMVIDAQGRQVHRTEAYAGSAGLLNLPIQLVDLVPGRYFVRAQGPGGVQVTPLTVVR